MVRSQHLQPMYRIHQGSVYLFGLEIAKEGLRVWSYCILLMAELSQEEDVPEAPAGGM